MNKHIPSHPSCERAVVSGTIPSSLPGKASKTAHITLTWLAAACSEEPQVRAAQTCTQNSNNLSKAHMGLVVVRIRRAVCGIRFSSAVHSSLNKPRRNVLHAAWENLELGRAIRDPCFLHSFAVPGSESPANTTVSLLHTITLSPKFYVEISITFLKHP